VHGSKMKLKYNISDGHYWRRRIPRLHVNWQRFSKIKTSYRWRIVPYDGCVHRRSSL